MRHSVFSGSVIRTCSDISATDSKFYKYSSQNKRDPKELFMLNIRPAIHITD